jgi:colanic acid/amylovoran biosynthesis protein
MRLGKPVVLWGASVGPFDREPHFVPVIRAHLERMALITARESVSAKYLAQLGLDHLVVPVADPAFVLPSQPVDAMPFWPESSSKGVVGLNISPLLLRYRTTGGLGDDLLGEAASFIHHAVTEQNLGVLLVPHVVPYAGTAGNNDALFMAQLLPRLRDLGNKVRLVRESLNAAQIKYVISRCRFFIGARTHSTIAAISSGMPTTSIAYSVKAVGINKDIFGHVRYVIDPGGISAEALAASLQLMFDEEEVIRDYLDKKMVSLRANAVQGAIALRERLSE